MNSDDINTITTSKYIMTKYEKAEIIGLRAAQISNGSPIYIDPKGETDVGRIALMELLQGKLPMKIERTLPNGKIIVIKLKDMIIT